MTTKIKKNTQMYGPNAWNFKNSGRKLFHAGVVTVGFILIGLACILFGDRYVPDSKLVGICCFGAAAFMIHNSQHDWKKKVVLTINKRGLWFSGWDLPAVPWNNIKNAYTSGSRLRPMLQIELKKSVNFFHHLSPETLKRVNKNPLVKTQKLLIPSGVLQKPLPEIAKIIRTMMQQDGFTD